MSLVRTPIPALLGSVITLLVLTACSDAPPTDQTFESVDDLRAAYEDEGGSCPDWQQLNQVDLATESGICDDSTTLSIYSDRPSTQSAVDSLEEILGPDSAEVTLLVGANWIINGDAQQLYDIESALAGEVVSLEFEPLSIEEDSRTPENPLSSDPYFYQLREEHPTFLIYDDEEITSMMQTICGQFEDFTFEETIEQNRDGALIYGLESREDVETLARASIEKICPENEFVLD